MEDDEHQATMLKLYHPKKKINEKKSNKSRDTTEPPSLNVNNNDISRDYPTNTILFNEISHSDNNNIRPHIIDNGSPSFKFDNQQRIKYKIEIEDDNKDETDTASDRFVAGFIADDPSQNDGTTIITNNQSEQ